MSADSSSLLATPNAVFNPVPPRDVVGNSDKLSMSTPLPTKQAYHAIVMHDFSAERPDELIACRGDAITVIAHSNRDWFLAQPIGKLCHPGLIPISFVELHDSTNGQPVKDVMALLDCGIIPHVDEWKKARKRDKMAGVSLGDMEDFTRGDVAPLRHQQQALLPEGILYSANIGSFRFENGEYWFRVDAVFQSGDRNNGHPPPALQLVLFRTYNDFYKFQITLLDLFPIEAGREPPLGDPNSVPMRTLPYMPGPVSVVDAVVTAERCTQLDEYVRNLSQLRKIGSEQILRHELVRAFFCPQVGDAELEISPVLFQTSHQYAQDDMQHADQTRRLGTGRWQTPPADRASGTF